jgi:hypothetical protein
MAAPGFARAWTAEAAVATSASSGGDQSAICGIVLPVLFIPDGFNENYQLD